MIISLKIKKFTELLLAFIRTDYNNATVKTNSWLYRVLQDDQEGSYNYYTNAVEVFINRDDNNKRKIEVRNGFDPDRATQPTIHVREPAKTKGKTDAIGLLSEDIYENEDETITSRVKYSHTSRFELMVTGANINEVILIEEVLSSALMASFDSLIIPYFDLISIGSKEVIIASDNYDGGRPIFTKTIDIDVSYEKNNVPKLYTEENVTTIEFENPELLNI